MNQTAAEWAAAQTDETLSRSVATFTSIMQNPANDEMRQNAIAFIRAIGAEQKAREAAK